jgi:PAS domain S-box-containing protein
MTKTNKKIIVNNAVLGFGIGLLFPAVSCIIDFLISGMAFTFTNFLEIQRYNPVQIVVNFVPILGAIAGVWLTKRLHERREEYDQIISEKNEKINRNAEFAKEIGEGNYNVKIDLKDENDALSTSLVIMRDNLLKNYEKETNQNWITEGKELISGILRMYNKIDQLSYNVLTNLIEYINVVQGAIYVYNEDQDVLTNMATYAYDRKKYLKQEYKIGEGLIGACAYEKDIIYRTEIPDDYAILTSGILGDKKPHSLILVPLIGSERLQGVMEFASTDEKISQLTLDYLKEVGETIGRTLYNLKINLKTEQLLEESQQKTKELQESEEQLRQNAEEMRITQEELERSNEQLESKIKEVKNAQNRLNSLLENAFEIISIYDKNKQLTFVSPSVNKILGFTIAEMQKGKDREQIAGQGREEYDEMLDALINNPTQPITTQFTYIKKDGSKIFLEITGRNLLNDPAINGIILNARDITARKRAEKEERMRSRMQSLSENSLDLIIRLSLEGECFYANPVIEDYLCYKPEEINNRKILSLNIPEVLKQFLNEIFTVIKTNPQKIIRELSLPINTGSLTKERIMSLSAIPEFNESELETILFVGHDITEAKRIEREIQDKNRKIEDSINYAQRIQSSILPNNKNLKEVFPKSFIYYKPRDVISGDFPWLFRKNDYIYIAAVDCTGHGVPGTLLSFIGYFTLNNVVDHDDNLTAAKICDRLHYNVRVTLNQDKPDAYSRDGMDIAFCKINPNKQEIQYCGAHRPLYLLRGEELIEYKGDKKAIGGIPNPKKIEQNFTNHVIKYKEKDKIFFFSDGLPDQLGGPKKKKYTPKQIKENIELHHDYSMTQFMNFFESEFDNWKGDNKQIDDVILIGIEF